MNDRTRKRLSIALGGALLVGVAIWTRRSLGIELDPNALRELVLGLGPAAPLACVLLITFRSLLGIPSQVALVVAGLCFGTLAGTFYGATGLTASGLGSFLIARYAGRDALESRIPARLKPLLEQAGERPGALFIAVGTGYPIGFITAYHAMAGVTAMRLWVFVVSLAIGSTLRAATYAFFGSSLVAGDLTPILRATAVIGAAFAIPLLFPGARAWLRRVVWMRD
jgi:uncharacterized membrane protein YdjX (TVP38/TMEM64 family)